LECIKPKTKSKVKVMQENKKASHAATAKATESQQETQQ
jgi:hypothetical protein